MKTSKYVECLANMLGEESEDHEDLTAPLLVKASVPKTDFQEQKADKYTFEVIGGIQRFQAILKVNAGKNRNIITRKCGLWCRYWKESFTVFSSKS